MGNLLSEEGSRDSGTCSSTDGHDRDAEDPTSSEPDHAEGAKGEMETETETAKGASSDRTQRGGSGNRQKCLRLIQHLQFNSPGFPR